MPEACRSSDRFFAKMSLMSFMGVPANIYLLREWMLFVSFYFKTNVRLSQ